MNSTQDETDLALPIGNNHAYPIGVEENESINDGDQNIFSIREGGRGIDLAFSTSSVSSNDGESVGQPGFQLGNGVHQPIRNKEGTWEIPVHYFKVHAHHDERHIKRAHFWNKTLPVEKKEQLIKEAGDLMQEWAGRIRLFAREEIEESCKKYAQAEKLYFDKERKLFPTNFDELIKAWKLTASKDNVDVIFDIMIGQFDLDKQWCRRLECKFMNMHNIKYCETPLSINPTRKNTVVGCISSLIRATKKDILKKINRAGRANAGVSVGTTRNKEAIESANSKWTRRIRGKFETSLARVGGEDETTRERKKQVRIYG